MATKSFIEEGEVGSQGRRQWRVLLAFEELYIRPSVRPKIIAREGEEDAASATASAI